MYDAGMVYGGTAEPAALAVSQAKQLAKVAADPGPGGEDVHEGEQAEAGHRRARGPDFAEGFRRRFRTSTPATTTRCATH